MDKQQAKEYIQQVRKDNPELISISIDYYGSGDCFDEFTHGSVKGIPQDFELDQDFLWYLLEQSDANFNDDGCQGTVIVTLRPELKAVVEVEHNSMTTYSGNGHEEGFETLPDSNIEDVLKL